MVQEQSIKDLLEYHLPKTIKITKPLVEEITTLLLRVLFCVDDATAFPRFFVKKGYFALARDARPLKNSFLSNGYTLKNCKTFVHAVAIGEAQPKDYRKFGVLKEDISLLLNCAQQGGVFTFCRAQNQNFKYVPPEVFDRALSEELAAPKMISFMEKFIYKKLKFVMNSQGLNVYDLKTEFLAHSIIRVYRTYPRIENRVHLRNLLRQVIHARGQSMIVETAKSKRSNLIRLSSGEFLGRLAPFHLIPREMMDANRENLSCSITGGIDSEDDWIFKQDLSTMIRAHSTSVKAHRFLTAVFDPQKEIQFITYLKCNLPKKLLEDPDDVEMPNIFMEHKPQDYVAHAITWSEIDPDEGIRILRNVKESCIN